MSKWSSMRYWALQVKNTKQQGSQHPSGNSGGWWSWINSVASGINHFLTGQFADFVKGVEHSFSGVVAAIHAMQHTMARIEISALHWVVRYLKRYTDNRIRQLQTQILRQFKLVIGWVKAQISATRLFARSLVINEAAKRHRADVRLDHEIKTRIKWVHQHIEREAASAYHAQRGSQDATITKLLDLVANLNPVLRPLVKDVVKGILDLATVDDPLARIALGFALRHVIDRLGIDKPIGHLLHNLLTAVIGHGRPHSLHTVIGDMCSRLAAGEQQWAQFYSDGGSEVQQAGEQWQQITSLTTDALLLGVFGLMAAKPAEFANEVTSALATVVHDSASAVDKVIKGVG